MAELFPLSDLRDPVAFLMGARVPLVVPSAPAARHEWCCDHYYQRNSHGYAFAFRTEGLVWSEVSLDLTDPDVARWVDRRIGEGLGGVPSDDPVLAIFNDKWVLDRRCCSPNRMFVLAANHIKRTPTNAAMVRAALLRALYGKEAT